MSGRPTVEDLVARRAEVQSVRALEANRKRKAREAWLAANVERLRAEVEADAADLRHYQATGRGGQQ